MRIKKVTFPNYQAKYPPDWKDIEDYHCLMQNTLNQWAWEFLRRNPEYINDYKEYEDDNFTISLKWGINGLLKDPSKRHPDIKSDYDFGIGFDPPGGFETLTMGKTPEEKEHLYCGLPNFETGLQSIEFNFKLPINPQLEQAKKMLLMLQKKAKGRKAFKPRKSEWILLLRILDAKRADIRDKQIAEQLFSELDAVEGIKKVHDKYQQALKYINHDYRLIPYSEI